MPESVDANTRGAELDFLPPPSLFHYCRWGDRAQLALSKNVIKLTTPHSWNDPFECIANYTSKGTKADKISRYASRLTKSGFSAREAQRTATAELGELNEDELVKYAKMLMMKSETYIRKLTGSFCMSTNPACNLMWSHYAEYHKGVCVEFAVDPQRHPKEGFFPVKVDYWSPILTIDAFTGLQGDDLSRIYRTKAHCWAYEQEWRLIPSLELGFMEVPHDLITAVYAGWRMGEANLEELKGLLLARTKNRPKLYKMTHMKGKCRLVPHRIEL